VCQGCGLSPYLFTIFINYIIEYIDIEGTHSLVINGLGITGLLFVDDMAIASFTSYELQKKIVNIYISNIMNKSKIMVFKKGGKLKATERWKINGQNTEVVDKFNYEGVKVESTGCWNKQKTLAKTKGYEALLAIQK
jgi:hypothetical protein